MSHAGHASASVRLVNERMLLTASGRVRNLTTDRLAVVDHDGKPLDGQLEPAVAEIVPMHAAVYRARPNVGGVIHTHPPAVTAFALAHRPLPCRYEALLRFGQATAAPVVPWAPQVCPCHRLPGHSQLAIRGTAPAFWVERHLRPTRWGARNNQDVRGQRCPWAWQVPTAVARVYQVRWEAVADRMASVSVLIIEIVSRYAVFVATPVGGLTSSRSPAP
ncbi:hypothetical protein B1T50_11280 [Mycobacterium kansasii]|nr:hypothetical protein B1T50_11280 [Mycobacterium kansasii]